MPDFPSNSQKAKATGPPREEQPQLQPVTSAETRPRKKKGIGRKFKEVFFAGSAKDAGTYMVEEEVLPAIRDMFHGALHAGIDRLIYGDRASGRSRSSSIFTNVAQGSRVDYSRITSPKGPQAQGPTRTSSMSQTARAHHNFSDLVIPSRREAEEVLERMYDILSQGGDVSVAHLYTLTGIRPEHTDNKWGWTSLRGSKVIPLRRQGGFLLDLPDPEPLT